METGMEYLDFELEIDLGTGRQYPVSVVRSPAGEARATMLFPFDTLALKNHLQALEIALLRSGGPGSFRRAGPPGAADVTEFGKALFNALLPAEIRGRYVVSREKAASQGKGLRLKLRIRPAELAALPWEFLYDPDEEDFICLSRSTPIVRYLEMPQSTEAIRVVPPLRVLGMVSSPSDLPKLDTTRERQRVEEALKQLTANGRVELTWLEGQTWRDLREAMWSGPWHVFHFVGHGEFDSNSDAGLLIFTDDDGRSQRLTANQLARLLNDHESLRLVVLNSCDGARAGDADVFSSSAATLVRRGIPAVVAMQYEITDDAAIEFARTFYRATAFGMPVDAAVAEARSAILIGLDNSLEWGTPVLYMRSGDGHLFDFQSAATPLPVLGGDLPSRSREPSGSTAQLDRPPTDAVSDLVPHPSEVASQSPVRLGAPPTEDTASLQDTGRLRIASLGQAEPLPPVEEPAAAEATLERIEMTAPDLAGGSGQRPNAPRRSSGFRRFALVTVGAVGLVGILGLVIAWFGIGDDEQPPVPTNSREDERYVQGVCGAAVDFLDTVDGLGASATSSEELFEAFAESFADFADELNRTGPPSDARRGNAEYVARLRSLAFRLQEQDLTVLEELDNEDGIRVAPDIAARLNVVADRTDDCLELASRGGGYPFEAEG